MPSERNTTRNPKMETCGHRATHLSTADVTVQFPAAAKCNPLAHAGQINQEQLLALLRAKKESPAQQAWRHLLPAITGESTIEVGGTQVVGRLEQVLGGTELQSGRKADWPWEWGAFGDSCAHQNLTPFLALVHLHSSTWTVILLAQVQVNLLGQQEASVVTWGLCYLRIGRSIPSLQSEGLQHMCSDMWGQISNRGGDKNIGMRPWQALPSKISWHILTFVSEFIIILQVYLSTCSQAFHKQEREVLISRKLTIQIFSR